MGDLISKLGPVKEIPSAVVERRTPRLILRRPQSADLDFVYRVHSDERTYRHAPLSRHTSREQSELRLREYQAHWDDHGFGYWIAEDRETGQPIGTVGVQHAIINGRDSLNLYYRFDPDSAGRGLGREGAREAVAFASEWLPNRSCVALARAVNVASIRTAEAAGLSDAGETRENSDADADGPYVVLESPTFEQLTDPTDAYDELIDLWGRVNAAGGAVGFMGATRPTDVQPVIEHHLETLASELSWLGVLRSRVDHQVLGFGFWQLNTMPQMSHVASMQRLMIDPDQGGHNLGRILVGRLHALARDNGIEISRLTYRGGTGLGDFYSRCGYCEVGRLPGALRFGSDTRDEVEMASRLDGLPL